MPTLLTYDFMTEPFPLQASPDTGDLLKTKLTIVATNQGSGDAALEGIQITLPEGPAGTDLTPDASTVLDVTAPPHWTRQIDNVPANVFLFQPDDGYGTVGAGDTLTFVITGLQINRKDGTADVPVVEGSGGCQPPDCPTAHLSITKFPNGWGEVLFSVDPMPPIKYGQEVTLQWSGPASATYTIRYRIKGETVTVPGPLGSHGSWPGQKDPSLILGEDTPFYLRAVYGEHTAEQYFLVAVDQPPPRIKAFKAEWSAEGDKLIFTWDTQHAQTCSLSGQHAPVYPRSLDGSFYVTATADQPLLSSYTLSAENETGDAPPSTVRMVLQQAKPIALPDSPHYGLLATSPQKDVIAAIFYDEKTSVTVYVIDPDSGAPSGKHRIENLNEPRIMEAAFAPRGSRLYLIGSGIVLMLDTKDPSSPAVTMPAGEGDYYLSVAASAANVLVCRLTNDWTNKNPCIVVLDGDSLVPRTTIPLQGRTVQPVSVRVWPVGSPAFVVAVTWSDTFSEQLYAEVLAIDVNAGKVTKAVRLDTWSNLAVLSPDTKRFFVAGQSLLTVIDTDSLEIVGKVSLPGDCQQLAISPGGTEVIAVLSNPSHVGWVSIVIDAASLEIVQSFAVDVGPDSVIFTPDNTAAFFLTQRIGGFEIRNFQRVPTGGTPAS
jgi:hypothetical protein